MDFLKRIGDWCERGDGLLIGVDLQKRREILDAAYNDSRGVTAAFNLNLLRRANRELGANFNLGQFRHLAVYDETKGRIEMKLVSERAQEVFVGGEEITFGEGEAISTEYSYKYSKDSFAELAGGGRVES